MLIIDKYRIIITPVKLAIF